MSTIEHTAVKESTKRQSEHGFAVDYAPFHSRPYVDAAALAKLFKPETILGSIMASHNYIGDRQSIVEKVEKLSDKPTITFHVDAVQAIGKIPFSD